VEKLSLLHVHVNVVCPVLREVVELMAVLRDGVVLSVSCTPSTVGRRLRPKILDMIGSFQQKMAGEPYTPYQIWLHHSRLKRRDHQPKKK
jgi:hypothetical protein